MHLPLLKALIAVISASVLGIGVALASAGNSHHTHSAAATTKARTLETDGLQFLGQLAAGNVKPDPALKQSWTDDVSPVAHSLGLSTRALARQLSASGSLAQIAASHGVPTSIPRNVLPPPPPRRPPSSRARPVTVTSGRELPARRPRRGTRQLIVE